MNRVFPCALGRATRGGWAVLWLGGGLLLAGNGSESRDPGPAAPADLEALLWRAAENARREAEEENRFKALYAYERLRVTDTLSAEGEVKKRDFHHHIHTPACPEPDPHARDGDLREGASARAYQRRDVQVSPELLSRFRFSYAGREPVAGRAAWVVDFVPAGPRLPAPTLLDRFINRTAGRLWIDAADELVVRARFRLLEPVPVVGGLVGALRECEVTLDRERTPEGCWYTRLLTWRIEGRKLFSRRIMTHREELLNVRRWSSDQARPAADPGPAGAAAGAGTAGPD